MTVQHVVFGDPVPGPRTWTAEATMTADPCPTADQRAYVAEQLRQQLAQVAAPAPLVRVAVTWYVDIDTGGQSYRLRLAQLLRRRPGVRGTGDDAYMLPDGAVRIVAVADGRAW